MVEVTSAQLYGWLALYFWPFVRILGLLSVAPVFGENQVPARTKVVLAGLIALLLAPMLPPPPAIPPVSWPGLWLIARELVIGIAMGLTMRLALAAVQAAGEYIGLQMGLSYASFFSPDAGGTTTVLSRLLHLFAMLLLLAFDIHLMMIQVLVDSFQLVPIGPGGLAAEGSWRLASFGTTIFATGLLLSLPLVAALLIINLAMGILNRASPQFSVFSVGFPITLLAGLLLLMVMLPELGGYFSRLFSDALRTMQSIAAGFAGG
ncbi:flagellar biosynthetic protein FliR [Halotalea alkalilenta]|uniref:Flagellar biosynthetic protein FliR n=1 Tax=Halotalea alkalilenta TaxID=376489 RepID=A0A172YHA8_9GAMM|nr:flagellar biosynthetic protein FliR [Halotalea alkalilenta]ANF58365.1 flagellar biosynthetic protein FliR [Halotalea alkalilenta]